MAFVPDGAIEKCSELSIGAWKLYTVLCKFRGRDGTCWPAAVSLAELMGCRKASVLEWRRELIRKQWIEVTGKRGQSFILTLRSGFDDGNLRGTESVPLSGTPNVPLRGTENVPKGYAERTPRGTFLRSKRYEKAHAHIRMEPAHEPAHVVTTVVSLRDSSNESIARMQRGAHETLGNLALAEPEESPPATGSRHRLEDLQAYASSKPAIRNPAGLARMLQRSGEDDLLVDAFLERKNKPPIAPQGDYIPPNAMAQLQELIADFERMGLHDQADECRKGLEAA